MEWKLNAFGIFVEWIIGSTSVNDEIEKCPIKFETEINAKHRAIHIASEEKVA